MGVLIVLSISFVFQVVTLLLALRLIRMTGKLGFGLSIAALAFLMAGRRALILYLVISGGTVTAPDFFNETIGLAISALMLLTVPWLTRILCALEQSEASLRKRVQELDSLYALACLAERPNSGITDVLEGLLEIIPSALEVPDRAEVCIRFEGRAYSTPGWAQDLAGHVEDIVVYGSVLGRLSVCYRTEAPGRGPRPFLDEEKRLFNIIATRLGRLIEQIRAHTAIRRERDFAESLIETAQAIVLVLDTNGLIYRFNRYMEGVSGYSLPEVSGKDWCETFLPPHDRAATRAFLDKIMADAKIHGLIGPMLTKNGQLREIEWSGRTLRDSDGSILGLLAIGQDITERRQTEKDMKRQAEQLAQADKMASLGVLVTGVAHEINNPNHLVMMSVSMLSKIWSDTAPILEQYYAENGDFLLGGLNYSEARNKMPAMLERVREGAERIRTIVQELRDFARQSSYDRTELVDVNEVVRSTMVLLSNMLKRSAQHVTINFAENIPPIRGNFRRLEQVVVNLVQNACQALPDQDRSIELSTTHDPRAGTVTISVRDEGVGIPEDALGRILDPFYTTKQDTGGTGLGLSIAASIVEEHQGTLSFLSSPGQGTTASIVLPVER